MLFKALEEEVRMNQPIVNTLNDHHMQLQSFVNPMGANETNKQNTNANSSWNTIKDKVYPMTLKLFSLVIIENVFEGVPKKTSTSIVWFYDCRFAVVSMI